MLDFEVERDSMYFKYTNENLTKETREGWSTNLKPLESYENVTLIYETDYVTGDKRRC